MLQNFFLKRNETIFCASITFSCYTSPLWIRYQLTLHEQKKDPMPLSVEKQRAIFKSHTRALDSVSSTLTHSGKVRKEEMRQRSQTLNSAPLFTTWVGFSWFALVFDALAKHDDREQICMTSVSRWHTGPEEKPIPGLIIWHWHLSR